MHEYDKKQVKSGVPVKDVKLFKKDAAKERADFAGNQSNAARVNQLMAEERQPVQRVENNTGLPDSLKTNMENHTGISLDDVKVHYNSDKPSGLGALAYTQGNQIYVGSGQEKHLPHEAWHVVQQKQGRVSANTAVAGQGVNDSPSLEAEADYFGRQLV